MSEASTVSNKMKQVKSEDTAPEIALRQAVWARGLRYRLHGADLPGKPDIVLPRHKIAVFVDGDYWHGNQWRQRGFRSLEEQLEQVHNKEYWLKKIERNMVRDQRVVSELISDGWRVIRFWESDITKDAGACADMILRLAEGKNGQSSHPSVDRSFAEFFAGIGLVRYALENAGWTIRFANDNDPDKQEMYQNHFRDADRHFVLGDVHKLHSEAVPTVTLATASFPCNDLSLAGAMKGLSGENSSAFWGFYRVLKEMGKRRPPVVMLENVMGFIYAGNGKDFQTVLLALNELGYVCDAFAVDAAHFVPQSRLRLFIVAVQSDALDNQPRLAFVPYISNLRPKKLAQFILSHPEISWNIRELPELPARRIALADIIEKLPDTAEEWWSVERVDYLRNQMSVKHGATADEMMQGKQTSYGAVFRRVRNGKSMAEMRVDGLAGALRTPRGGSGRQILYAAGNGKRQARLFTPRECARLMGADDYVINVPLNQALFGFGDAVCVPVIEWIANHYLNPLVNELLRNRVIGEVSVEPFRKVEYATKEH
ncbi:MAG: DNA mismatch endonuclease Vsr [Chloroflexi bacterium]|nr:DNA mismatch endonuclease Vsr [Chloroflexota bacterium]